MRLRNILVGAVAVLFAGGAFASPAAAAPVVSASDNISSAEPAAVTDSSRDTAARSMLVELAETQTSAEIEQLLASGEPVEALYDAETGTYLAARVEADLAGGTARAITPRPTGCASTDACATNASDHGYSGLGQLTISLPGVTKVTSGNAMTYWFWSAAGDGVALQPNLTVYLDAPVTMQSIERM